MPCSRVPVLAVTCALAAAGCGGDEPAPRVATPQGSDAGVAADRALVARWADTLRRSDVEGATRLFGVPLIVEQGGEAQRLRSVAEVRRFNASLPCGARLTEATRHGGYLIAAFRLGERPGKRCDAPGETATVALIVKGGRIREWRHIPELAVPGAPPADAESS